MKVKQVTVCRVCLQCDLDPDSVSSIFTETETGKVFIYEKLNTIAEVHIKPEDRLPDKICGDCLLELENAINFKHKCETSNSILLSAVNTGIGPIQDDEDPLDAVKSEPEEFADQEYFEEDVWSPSEVSIKADPDPQLGDTDLHSPPAKKSKANDLQLQCHDCGGTFKSKCKLKVHWKKVHLREQLTCPVCQKTFRSFKKRNEHEVKKTRRCKTFSQVDVTGEGKHRVLHCRECEYSNFSIIDMTAHLVKHNKERNICKLCPKQFQKFAGLQVHMESVHGTEEQRVCKFCGKSVLGRKQYINHLRTHRIENALVSCKICKKTIKRNSLKVHIMTVHSSVRPYACDQCVATFKTFTFLSTHIRNVHKQNIIKCDQCEYSAKNNTSMRRHRSRHTGNDFPCTECGRFFDNELQLLLHKPKHTNRDHKCLHCDSTFYSKKNLASHVHKQHK